MPRIPGIQEVRPIITWGVLEGGTASSTLNLEAEKSLYLLRESRQGGALSPTLEQVFALLDALAARAPAGLVAYPIDIQSFTPTHRVLRAHEAQVESPLHATFMGDIVRAGAFLSAAMLLLTDDWGHILVIPILPLVLLPAGVVQVTTPEGARVVSPAGLELPRGSRLAITIVHQEVFEVQ